MEINRHDVQICIRPQFFYLTREMMNEKGLDRGGGSVYDSIRSMDLFDRVSITFRDHVQKLK
jgi:hypothetical protein